MPNPVSIGVIEIIVRCDLLNLQGYHMLLQIILLPLA